VRRAPAARHRFESCAESRGGGGIRRCRGWDEERQSYRDKQIKQGTRVGRGGGWARRARRHMPSVYAQATGPRARSREQGKGIRAGKSFLRRHAHHLVLDARIQPEAQPTGGARARKGLHNARRLGRCGILVQPREPGTGQSPTQRACAHERADVPSYREGRGESRPHRLASDGRVEQRVQALQDVLGDRGPLINQTVLCRGRVNGELARERTNIRRPDIRRRVQPAEARRARRRGGGAAAAAAARWRCRDAGA